MSERVVIFAAGTEGDARPYMALGAGLAAAGADVVLATSANFAARVRALGLRFAPITADFEALAQRYPGLLDGACPAGMVRTLLREMAQMSRGWAAECWQAAQGARLVIGSGNVALAGASVAEKLGVPFVMSWVQPFEPSRALPPVLLPVRARPGPVNLALHHGIRAMIWRMLRRPVDALRRELGLAPYPFEGPWALAHGWGGPTLYGFSSHVVPRQPEWPERIAVPGYFVLSERQSYAPPPHLARFLAAGPPPVYIGFGSMISGQAAELARQMAAAVRLAGTRAVVSRGWMGFGDTLDADPDICVIDAVPHDWLLPRMSAAVHHCGVGTVAAAVRAGIATVPVPFAGDQYFCAWQLRRLGVAVGALDRRGLRAEQLAAALREAAAPAMRERAAALGSRVRAEDGVGAAVRQLAAWGFVRQIAA